MEWREFSEYSSSCVQSGAAAAYFDTRVSMFGIPAHAPLSMYHGLDTSPYDVRKAGRAPSSGPRLRGVS